MRAASSCSGKLVSWMEDIGSWMQGEKIIARTDLMAFTCGCGGPAVSRNQAGHVNFQLRPMRP